MDVYVVRCGWRIIGVSARLQGAELLRADYERAEGIAGVAACSIENHELEDADD